MSSNVTKDRQTDVEDAGWRAPREQAPSEMRADEPLLAQIIGMVGLMLLVLGSVALVFRGLGRATFISQGLALVAFVIGLGAMLFHAARDKEQQVRRLYGLFGLLLIAAGVVVSVLKTQAGPAGTLFFPYGFCGMAVGLFFLIAFVHSETEDVWRDRTTLLLGAIGLACALLGLVGANIWPEFLLGLPGDRLLSPAEAGFRPVGLLLSLLGLLYLAAYVGIKGPGDDRGYRAGQVMAALGVLALLVGLARSVLPPLFHSWNWITTRPESYLIPNGFLLMLLGALYALVAFALISDALVLVMARRELAAYFYSPIAYVVLLVSVVIAGLAYVIFLGFIVPRGMNPQPPVEPIVQYYVIAWWPILTVLLTIPLITMGLLSEERRTGTLEVLLTAPVNETPVVVSKFLAALAFFQFICLPWGLYLLALRIQGGEPFDYRPLLSYLIAMTVTGSAFLSMGLFFSSLTRSQIAAAILTCAVLIGWVVVFFLRFDDAGGAESAWRNFLQYVSFIDFWMESVRGTLSPRFVIFYSSVAVFWLFLTHKVLEARKWS
jgi:ABC-2 type transport system permease protein